MFSVVAKKSGTFFPVSHVHLMSRSAGAGREHSQAASPSWPVEVFATKDVSSVYGGGLAREGSNSPFSVSSGFSCEFCKIRKFGAICALQEIHGFHGGGSRTDCTVDQLSGSEQNCTVCHLFCILLIAIISFVAC